MMRLLRALMFAKLSAAVDIKIRDSASGSFSTFPGTCFSEKLYSANSILHLVTGYLVCSLRFMRMVRLLALPRVLSLRL